jgi:hypothetical protein
MIDEIIGLAPSGSMGSGYNLDAFERGLAARPHFIGQDAGSTDMGPYYHGTGATFLPLATYRYDLAIMLRAARRARIPLVIGSALTSGANVSLRQAVDLVHDIAREDGFSFRMAVISAEIDKADLKRRLARSAVRQPRAPTRSRPKPSIAADPSSRRWASSPSSGLWTRARRWSSRAARATT